MIKVDYFGSVGEEGGVGNYSTKLFYQLNQIDDLEVKNIEFQWSFPLLEMTFHNLIELPYRIWKSNADVIHLTDQAKASGLVFLPESMTKNVVVTVHDISPYVNDYAGRFSQLISHFAVRGLKKASRLIAISQFTKDELIEHLDIDEEKIDVVYQGVDTDYFYPREPDEEILKRYGIEKPYILYVGSEIGRKNMEGVIKKFAQIQKENPELSLVKVGTAGRKKYRRATRDYIDKYELKEGKDVVFTGFVDEEDLPQVYSSAEATILWSHYEGFGRSVLEAKACGTDVITQDMPPMKEFVDEDAKFFRWGEQSIKVMEVYRELEDNGDSQKY